MPHPFPWNPDYVWQVLRRSRTFRSKIDFVFPHFKRQKHIQDLMVRVLSEEAAMFGDHCFCRNLLTGTPDLRNLDRLRYLQDDDYDERTAVFEELARALSTREWYLDFQIFFADVIRLPIHYRVVQPDQRLLKASIVFRPLFSTTVPPPKFLRTFSHLPNTANWQFSDSLIEKTLETKTTAAILSKARSKSVGEMLRPSWDHFEENLLIFDLRHPMDPSIAPLSATEIARRIFDDPTATNLVASRLQSMTKLIGFFEREKPLFLG